jgi:hypothetical protein
MSIGSWTARTIPDVAPELCPESAGEIVAHCDDPRELESAGLAVESKPGHPHVLRDGKPLRKQNGMPFTLPFSPDTTRWRRAAIVELRKLGIDP